MAIGVDQWLAEEAIKLSIPVVAAIPFLGQEALWPAASKEAYRNILSHCTSSIIVCPGPYASWKMQKRNEWMVDRCDILLAVWNRKEEGGTWNTVKYARSQNRTIQIHYITPPEKPL